LYTIKLTIKSVVKGVFDRGRDWLYLLELYHSILVSCPREYKTQALKELREKLGQNQFREQKVQKAHQLVHNQALANIISIRSFQADYIL
jgi:hypothetical protein